MMGQITMTAGGSTRNTAECLGRLGLGAEVLFVSGIGDDIKNIIIRQSLEQVGVST
jgi:sugar/nucleoside kinase (ribokinase family)